MNSRTKIILVVSLSLILAVSLFFAVLFYSGSRAGLDGAGAGAGQAGRAAAGKGAGDKAKAKEPPLPDTLTAAFYNVENLFDFNLDGTEYDEYKPGWYGWTEEVQLKKLENVASVVAAVGADIIGLCEVENASVLRELQGLLDRMDVPYPYAVAANAPRSATVTALLSRFPVRETFEYPVESSRPILEAAVARGGDELRVFVNHWPSKRHPESARLAAAEILRRRIDELPPGTDYIIVGDLNSGHDEFATFHTAGFNDTKGRTGINHALKTAVPGPRPYSPYRFVCQGEMAACADCHYNPWLGIAEGERRSYVFRGANQAIDHILLPPSMFDTLGFSYMRGSFEAFTWDGRLLKDGVPYRWQMVFRGKQKYHTGNGYSDHLPVRAKFVRASPLYRDTSSVYGDDAPPTDGSPEASTQTPAYADNCDNVDPALVRGDFAVTVDGWMSGDGRFTVARDPRFKRTGTHSLRISGMHDSENKTAARARLQTAMFAQSRPQSLTMYIRGSGNLSVRIRRPEGSWECYNAPGFTKSKSARYNAWKSDSWTNLKFPLPEGASPNDDVQIELRAGKGEPFSVWIDMVRLE